LKSFGFRFNLKIVGMKVILSFIALIVLSFNCLAQSTPSSKEKPLFELIDQYALARDQKDTVLLSKILTKDIDQLVSTGEWRKGYELAKEGMLRSSSDNPGDRKLIVEQTRFLNASVAIIDARYEIKNSDGTVRKMWSTFVAVLEDDVWKISAIRNMLPRTND